MAAIPSEFLKVGNSRTQCTCGSYETEKEAVAAFDEIMDDNPFFRVEEEVVGRRVYDILPKRGDYGQAVRPDRLLCPTRMAVDSGWIFGPIGVEIKRSNVALGPVLAQVMEYRNSSFVVGCLGNARIMPMFFAVFPAGKITNDLESILNTQSIMTCSMKGDFLRFWLSRKVMDVSKSEIQVHPFEPSNRRGSRGAVHE